MSAACEPDPALVVLAAGASTRLGQPKALARLRPGPGGRALELLLAAGATLGAAWIVTGAHHADLAAERWSGARLLENRRWRAGRSTGVRLAVEELPDRDLCLAPIDAPLVAARTFEALREAWRKAGRPARGWLGPCLAGTEPRRFGHPVVLGRGLLRELKAFPDDAPLHALRALAAPRLALEVTDAAILDDLDTPDDLARLRLRAPPGLDREA